MKIKNQRAVGFTLLELMIAMTLLGLIMAITFATYTMGARSWAKGDAKSDLLRASQIISAKTDRLVESSTSLSTSIAPDGSAAAFLSAEDINGQFLYNPVTLLPHWQKFVVLFHEPVERVVYIREVSVLGTTLENIPQTIDALNNGPVESYKSGGKPLGREIDQCVFTLTPDNQLQTEITSLKKHYGSEAPSQLSTRFLNTFRN